ncbi:MAG: hypothetical protein Q4D37_07400 [Oscillospiraceae bacterium]|nr:hypothetical protein [Oscillospiraceae bacterium]
MSEHNEAANTEKHSMFSKVAPVVLALMLAITSVVYIVCRTLSNRAYHEKWKDYDECGLG